ncbi:ABC transporter substrate-binding protein [Haematobacter genomosp. 1]|uniref:Peptide ABC transporter n=1 Tax=Haematobacter genomosp. 1 TaxID=366618 RepID=A0A212A915_9RHOB|nr:ABC transporter substrate-binding protein [Haematobacter genomosp. 1]OWJ76537.1 peptide ABC transporter [Haematobacter genomosp. 1]
MNFTTEERRNIARLLPDMRRRQILIGMGAAAAIGAIGLPGGLRAATTGTLTVAANANPSSLDPATGGSGSDHVFLFNFYDTLIDWTPDTLEPVPGLARAFTFTDPKTLVLDLQEGVTFHDGTPLDAEAVKLNLDRSREAQVSNIRADLETVESVEVTGPLQVTLHLKEPDSALPLILSDRAGMMISPKALSEAEGGRVDRAPVGAGPWKFTGWTDGERVAGEAYSGYWRQGAPGVAKIELLVVPEPTTRLRAVQSGQAQICYQLSERQIPIIKRTPNLTLMETPTLYIYNIYLNAGRGPLQDPRVRQALSLAIDRDAFLLATQAGVGEAAYGFLPKTHWAYSAEPQTLNAHDPDRAAALMKEAGVSGLELDFRGYPDQASVQRQEVIMSQLARIGVKGRFTNAPIAEASGRFFGPEKIGDALLSAWTGRPDPSMSYDLVFSQNSYFNTGKVAAPDGFDAAIAASRATADQAERKAALATAQKLGAESAISIPLTVRYEVDAYAEGVENFTANLLGKPKFNAVTRVG